MYGMGDALEPNVGLDGYTAVPYIWAQGVIETPTFLADARNADLSEDERLEIISTIAGNPEMGDLMPGTGGARKVRFAGRGKGKSGGYRVVTYYSAEDVPVLMLALIDKGERANLSKAERNELRKELKGFAEDYRAGVGAKVKELRRTRK
jgi:hypothetical protein